MQKSELSMVDIFNGLKLLASAETGDAEWDQAREDRIQLYSERWNGGFECISNELLIGEDLNEWYNWKKWYNKNVQKLDYLENYLPPEDIL